MTDSPLPSQQLRDAHKQPPDPRDVVAWRLAKTVALLDLAAGRAPRDDRQGNA